MWSTSADGIVRVGVVGSWDVYVRMLVVDTTVEGAYPPSVGSSIIVGGTTDTTKLPSFDVSLTIIA